MAQFDSNAEVAAKLEYYHDKLNNLHPGDSLKDLGLNNYSILETNYFTVPAGEYSIPGHDSSIPFEEPYIKAITVKDPDGNIYVHFYGTGDGNWRYNAVAYSDNPQPSRMQEWAAMYFEDTVAKNYNPKGGAKLYVSGHSQGGNMAQYVTLESETYGDYIEGCISMDGPGFSTAYLTNYIKSKGKEIYEKRREKIWQYIGENDYVSALGQERVYDEDHVRFLDYTGKGFDFGAFHGANGLVDENGHIHFVENDSALRKFIVNSVNKINKLPPEKQARAAELTMMICEDFLGSGEEIRSCMSEADFNEFKAMLGPLLIDILADTPELIVPVLQEWGMSEQVAESIANLIEGINKLPYDEREQVINGILEAVSFENGQIQPNWSKIPSAVVDVWPLIVKNALTHPEEISAILHEYHLDVVLGVAMSAAPFAVCGFMLSAVATAWLFDQEWFKEFVEYAEPLIDAVVNVVKGLTDIANDVKERVVKLFNSFKEAVKSIKEWLHNNFNAGVKYVANNPYFKANTDKLRNYAIRISRVNSRLRSLDSSMRSLYWQVGFLDLWKILCENLITSGSPTLNQVKNYLNNTADRIDNADNQARRYMED